MKKTKSILMFVMLGLFLLVGCSTEEATPSFILTEIQSVQWDDEETPIRYEVNASDRSRDQVILYRNDMISEVEFGQSEEAFELEEASVTEDEIVITYDGQTVRFERLSSSVVQNEDRQQYQYFDLMGE